MRGRYPTRLTPLITLERSSCRPKHGPGTNIVEYPIHCLPLDAHRRSVMRLMRATARTESVGESLEVDLVYLIEDRHDSLLDEFVLQSRDAHDFPSPCSSALRENAG